MGCVDEKLISKHSRSMVIVSDFNYDKRNKFVHFHNSPLKESGNSSKYIDNNCQDNDDVNPSRKIKFFVNFEEFDYKTLIEKVEFYFKLKLISLGLSLSDLNKFPPLSEINESNEYISEQMFFNFINYICTQAELNNPSADTLHKIYNDLKPSVKGLHRNQLLIYYLRISKMISDAGLTELQRRNLIFESSTILNVKDQKDIQGLINKIESKRKLLDPLAIQEKAKLNPLQAIDFLSKFIEDKFEMRVMKNLTAIYDDHIYPLILKHNGGSSEITYDALVNYLRDLSNILIKELQKAKMEESINKKF